MQLAFFTAAGEDLVPTDVARSLWSENQMHGVASSSAMARSAEAVLLGEGRDDLRPARWTVDLFRPAAMTPTRMVTRVVRQAPRLCLVDVTMVQGDAAVARASALFLKPTDPPSGEVWSRPDRPTPPPLDVVPASDQPRVPWFWSEGPGWSQDFAAHQNGSRKQAWQNIPPVLADEPLSGFVTVAGVADSTSLVTNWGSGGVGYINTDITLTLARLPVGHEVGLSATDHLAHDGLSVGTATLFDRTGSFGTTVVTALANARRAVDFTEHRFDDAGNRLEAPPGV